MDTVLITLPPRRTEKSGVLRVLVPTSTLSLPMHAYSRLEPLTYRVDALLVTWDITTSDFHELGATLRTDRFLVQRLQFLPW